ncbi:MAG: hypothetical protein ABEL51_03395 [Salinibacter sp.]
MPSKWRTHLLGGAIAVAVVAAIGLMGLSATLFFEDFQNPAEGWLEGPDPNGNGEWSFSEDTYRVLVTRPEGISQSVVPGDTEPANFCLEISSRVLSNRPAEVGLMFGRQGDDGSANTFGVFADGAYRLGRLDGSTIENLPVTTASRKLSPAGTLNTLQIVAQENVVEFRANGRSLAEVDRNDLSIDPRGEIGLFGRTLGQPLAQGEFNTVRIMTPDCEP